MERERPATLVQKLRRNFPHAVRGLTHAWRKEPQFPWQVLFAVIVFALALALEVGAIALTILAATLCLALGAELLNTAIEDLCDKVEPGHDPRIGAVKDLGAAFVVVGDIPALIATCVILVPRLLSLL